MFKKFFPIALALLLSYNIPVKAISSQSENPQISTEQKAQILRVVNTFRATQNLRPLGLMKRQSIAGLAKTSDSLSSGGAINGRLFSDDRGFHHIGYVTAWSADSTDDSGVAMTTVHPDGFYQLDNLNPGEYYVFAISEGFVPMFYDNAFNFHDATLVPVAEGDIVEGIDFKMQRTIPGTGSISGSVSGEFTDNTIADVVITVWSPDNRFFYGTTQTDENGDYTVTGLKTGEYYASASKEGYVTEFYENAENFTDADLIQVSEPNETGGINFTLSEGGKISGRVVDEDGDGVANARIEAMPVAWHVNPDSLHPNPDSIMVDTWGSATTDENGDYTVTGLKTADYYVSVHIRNPNGQYHFEYYDDARSIEEATPVAVSLGQETSGIDFEVPSGNFKGEIMGTVIDLAGNPLPRVRINLHVADDSSFAHWAPIPYGTTDENGKYHIKNIPYGNFYVQASYSEQWQHIQRWWPNAETQDGAEVVSITKETPERTLDFELPLTSSTGVISGYVMNASGDPLPHAFIEVTNASDVLGDIRQQIYAYANSDSNGFYQVTGLPQGEYAANAQYWRGDNFGQQWYDHKDSYEAADRIIIAENDTVTNINFDLDVRPYYGGISGVVINEETGERISRAYIEVTPLDFDMYFRPFYYWPYHAITDMNGEYALDWLPHGKYTVSVSTNGASEYYEDAAAPENATEVQVLGGEITTVDFGITKKDDGPGVISGRVSDEYHDGFLEIAVVKATPVQSELTDPNPEAVYTAVIDREGNYEITGLPQGEFVIFAHAPNHIGEYYDSVYDPAEATPILIDSVNTRVSGVDFTLQPAYFVAADFRNPETAPAVNATVLGKITTSSEQPISDASIYLMDENGAPVAYARSNAQGHYELSNIGQGSYKVKATHVGFRSKFNGDATSFEMAEALEITNGSYEVNLVLQPGSVTGVEEDDNTLPTTVQLYGNYPNPFNPTTQISFGLPEETEVKLSVYNLLGQKINELYNGKLSAGDHYINWNGRDDSGQFVPSGVYFYVLQAGSNKLITRKMTLLK